MAKLTLKLLDLKIEEIKALVTKQGMDLLRTTLKQPGTIKRHRRNIKYKNG